VKFGLSIPTLTGFPRATEPEGGWRERWQRTYEICAIAEDLGFDLGTVGQHRFTPPNIDSSAPLISLAALAARTSTLRLCTNILLLPTHNPLEVAEQCAVLDEISDGRIILGIGIGYRSYEFEKMGLDYRRRTARTEESIEVIRRAWSEEPVDFAGEFFTVNGADVSPKPVQKPGPPIWVGGRVAPAVSRAARLGDGWLTDNAETVFSLGPKVVRYREEAAAHGRSGVVALNRRIGIGPTRQVVEDGWLQMVVRTVRRYLEDGLTFADPSFVAKVSSGAPLGLEDMPAGQLIAGDPDDCIAAVELCRTETDADYIVCDFGRGVHGGDYERIKATIELFGREVMPAFR
jgi:probable F420-dependent oxidoreductase